MNLGVSLPLNGCRKSIMHSVWNIHPVSAIAIIGSLLALLPFCFALLWIFKLSFLPQGIVGVTVGFSLMVSFSITQTHRSHHRSLKAISIAQLALADVLSLRSLSPITSDVEKVRWLNAGLNKVWPLFKKASSGLLELKLESVLNQYKFGSIQEVAIKKIDLGSSYPYVQGIKASNGGNDELSLEIQLDWRHNEDQEMILHILTSGPEYAVQVRHFVVYAVLKLTFKPLKEEFPGFAAIVFSIIEPPLVDFQTKFLRGDPKKLPEMRTAVDNLLLSTLMDLLVWPSRVVVPFIAGDYSYLNVSCVGHLHVGLLEARDLANKEITGNSDPYVLLFVRRRQDSVKQSARMHDTSAPVWNEKFVFNIEDPAVQKLTVKVMNTDATNIDNCIGTMEFPINQLDANFQRDIWMDMFGDPKKLHGKIAGRVHFLLEYKPAFSNCTECHDIKAAVDEGYASTESINKMNTEIHILGESGSLNDAEVQNHAITGEKMLSEEGQVAADAVAKNCSPQGLKLFSEEPGITGNAMIYNHAPTAEKMPFEELIMENNALVEEKSAVQRNISQEPRPSTEYRGLITEGIISLQSLSHDLERNISTAEDTKCKQPLDRDSCSESHSSTWSTIQSFKESDCAKEEEVQKNQTGLYIEFGTQLGIERDWDHEKDKSGSMDNSRNLSLEECNPNQSSIKLSENHNRKRCNEAIDNWCKFIQEDMFSSELFEVD